MDLFEGSRCDFNAARSVGWTRGTAVGKVRMSDFVNCQTSHSIYFILAFLWEDLLSALLIPKLFCHTYYIHLLTAADLTFVKPEQLLAQRGTAVKKTPTDAHLLFHTLVQPESNVCT